VKIKKYLALILVGLGLTLTGCRRLSPTPRISRMNKVKIIENTLGADENKVNKLFSGVIRKHEGGYMYSGEKSRKAEETLEKELGKELVMNHGGIENLIDNYYQRTNEDLEVFVGSVIYSKREIKEIIDENNLKYLTLSQLDEQKHTIMSEEDINTLNEKIVSKYPNRLKRVQRYVEKKFKEELEKEKEEIIKKIKNNKKIAIIAQGIINPFIEFYGYYKNELSLNDKVLYEFFDKKGFEVFNIFRNKRNLLKIMDLIKQNVNHDQKLVLFYNGHGDENGLAIEDGCMPDSAYVSAKELASYFKDLKCKSELLVNNCFSGDINDYFREKNIPTTVVSSSKTGDVVSASEWDKPGYLVQDYIRSNGNLDDFENKFKDVEDDKYFPRIYVADFARRFFQ